MVDNISAPLLEVNEFEKEAEAILKSAKEEASRIIQEARDKAGELIEKEKKNGPIFEEEYLKKIDEELRIEREKLMEKAGEAESRIESIPPGKIQQAVDCIIDKVRPVRR